MKARTKTTKTTRPRSKLLSPSESKRKPVPDLGGEIQAGGQKLVRLRRSKRLPDEQIAVVLEPASLSDALAEPTTEPAPAPASPPAEMTEEDAIDSMDAIAKKHLGDAAPAVLGKYKDFIQALDEDDDEGEVSPAIDHARRLELLSDTAPLGAAVPHPESNPDKRADGAVSPVVLTSDAPDFLLGIGHPETIFDLFHAFPQLDGVNWFIYVERLEPRIYAGTRCDGMLRQIERPIDLGDWMTWYGGGKYKLLVYGPPKHGAVLDHSGKVTPRKLTEAITVKFPGPPSFESMVYDDGPGDPMNEAQPSFPPRRGPFTPSDAAVENKRIDVGDQREQRLREDAQKAQDKADKILKEQQGGQGAVIAELMKSSREASARESESRAQAIEREREMMREMREQTERFEEKLRQIMGEKKPDDVERLISLSGAMHKGGASVETLRDQHAREVERLMDQKTQAESVHQRALTDERQRADQRIREAEERADRRIKDAEDRASNDARELRSRLEQESQRQRDEQARQLAEEHRRTTERISDLERIHTRDLQALKDGFARDVETHRATSDMRLETVRAELKRAENDAERYRVEAEKGKDIVGQIAAAKEQAEALGMVDASEAASSEPESVPQMLAKAGVGMLGNLPAILENIASMMRGKNDQQIQIAREQGRQEAQRLMAQQPSLLPGSPQQPHPGRRGQTRQQIATQGPITPIANASPGPRIPGREPAPREIRPAIRPITADMQPEEVMAIEEAIRARDAEAARLGAQPQPQPMPITGQQPEQQVMPPEQQYQPMPASVPPPAEQPMPSDLEQQDADIVASEPLILQPYKEGITAGAFAQSIAATVPADQIRHMLDSLGSADRVSAAFLRQRGPSHDFARRDGKKYLKELFSELTRLTAGAV